MKIVFYTILSDDFKDTIIDYQGFYNSFKKFHPDIDLVVFGDKEINKLFAEKTWLNFCNCKASFAKLLYNDYDLVVNIDADFYFFDRLTEILEGNYELGACANYNREANVSVKAQILNGFVIPHISEQQYIQGGIVASPNKKFWDDYEEHSKNLADHLPLMENDVLNLLWYSGLYKTKVFDGDSNYNSPNFKQYYNCSILGREYECYLKNDKIFVGNKQVKAYHVANGNSGRGTGSFGRRKKRINQLFNYEISTWFDNYINNKI